MRHNNSYSSRLIKTIVAAETAIFYVDLNCISYKHSTCLNVCLISHKSILFTDRYCAYTVDEHCAVERDIIGELIVNEFNVILRLVCYMNYVH